MGVEDNVLELRSKTRLLELKVERLQVVVNACDAYHGKVRHALATTLEIARRLATPEERAQLDEIRRMLL